MDEDGNAVAETESDYGKKEEGSEKRIFSKTPCDTHLPKASQYQEDVVYKPIRQNERFVTDWSFR